jgi:hypothetical protein
MSDADKPYKRRSLDRAEERVLRLERELLIEMNKHGSTSYELIINIAIAFVARARERKSRGQMTDEDLQILLKYKDSSRRATDENPGPDWRAIRRPDFPPG